MRSDSKINGQTLLKINILLLTFSDYGYLQSLVMLYIVFIVPEIHIRNHFLKVFWYSSHSSKYLQAIQNEGLSRTLKFPAQSQLSSAPCANCCKEIILINCQTLCWGPESCYCVLSLCSEPTITL